MKEKQYDQIATNEVWGNIQNDGYLYKSIDKYLLFLRARYRPCPKYMTLIRHMGIRGKTPEGYSFLGRKLNYPELNECVLSWYREFTEEQVIRKQAEMNAKTLRKYIAKMKDAKGSPESYDLLHLKGRFKRLWRTRKLEGWTA